MTTQGPCTRLVLDLNGRIGWLDVANCELRTTHGIYRDVITYKREANEIEARFFFRIRAAMRKELTSYYAAPGEKGD